MGKDDGRVKWGLYNIHYDRIDLVLYTSPYAIRAGLRYVPLVEFEYHYKLRAILRFIFVLKGSLKVNIDEYIDIAILNRSRMTKSQNPSSYQLF